MEMPDSAVFYQLLGERDLVLKEESLPELGEGMVRARTLFSAVSPEPRWLHTRGLLLCAP